MERAVRSILEAGAHSALVEIECHLSNNLPAIVIVGSASKSVEEARERVRAAFASSQLVLPRKRITVNLAPADLPKNDSSFDLAIAAAILVGAEQIPVKAFETALVIGELGLNGAVRPARGIIGKIIAGRKLGFTRFFIPEANVAQAQLIPDVSLYPVKTLKQLYDYLTTDAGIELIYTGQGIWGAPVKTTSTPTVLHEIVGQAHAKRALQIAAAGGHNLFLSGPPGTGKSMLAKALPSLMPALTREEILEITQLSSLVTNDYDQIVTSRPFRSPHHSSSLVALVGGGHSLRPGEISLSHRGVLFLDEMPEFGRSALEALRQPLEDHVITVARAKDTATYPANFILVATANPCPCGYYGSARPCTCLPHQIAHYQQRVSGPILDRIDLFTTVQDVDHARLLQAGTSNEDESAHRAVALARQAQIKRYRSATKLNAEMSNKEIKTYAKLSDTAQAMLNTAAQRMRVSARSYMKTIKVARTIADLAGNPTIEVPHIAEALQYRRQEQPAIV